MKKTLRELLLPQAKSKIKAGNGLPEGMYKFFTCSPIQNKFYNEATFTGPSLIFGTGGNASVHYCNEPFSTSTDCLVMYGAVGANLELIYQYLHTNLHILQAGFKGAGLQHISKDYILDIEIDLPDEELQTRITKQIREIDNIIGYRNQQLSIYDDLVKSRFIEMFGNLDKNDKNWNELPLGCVCEQVKRYPTFCNMEYLESGIRVIRIGNILLDGHMDINDENYVFVYEGANGDYPETIIEKNDIVMAVRGDGSAAKRIGIVTEEKLIGANISPNLIRIKANSNLILPMFLFHYLTGSVGQKRLDAYVNKTAKKNIAAKDIVKVLTPAPPIELQKEYISFVEQTDKLKFEVKEALQKLEILKKSLMQQYFG